MADVVMEYKGEKRRVPESMVARMEAMGAKPVASAAPSASAGKTVEAIRQGAARGLTLGFDDVAAGAGAFLGDLVQRQRDSDAAMLSGGGESLADSARAATESFQAGQDERREVVAEAKAGDETAFSAAELLGMLMVPGGKGVKGAAAQGAAAGAGFSDADTLEDAAKSAAVGGVVGGVAGKVAPKVISGIGNLAGKGADAIKGVAGRALERAGAQADELRVLTTMGATGGSIAAPAILKEAANVPGGVPALAKTLRETGISRGITTTEGIAKRAGEIEERAGQEIGRMIDDATNAGGFVEVRDVTNRLRQQAASAVSGGKAISGVQRREADALNRLAERYDELFPGGVAPVREMKSASTALSQDAQAAYRARSAGRDVEGQGRALMEARRASEAGVDDALSGLGANPAAYQGAKTQFQAGRLAREAAETSLGRASKNNLLGLTDIGMLATTGPVGALARKFASPLAASARATAAETALALSQRLQQSPSLSAKMGPWAKRIADAGEDQTQLTRIVTKALEDPGVEKAIKADIADEAMKTVPPEQRRDLAATALSALGGPQFSAADFAKNYAQARAQGGPYAAIIKEVGRPGDEFLTSLFGASKKAKNDALFTGVLMAMGDGTLSGALKSDATLLSKAAAAMRDPSMVRLSGGRPSRGAIKAAANSRALRDFLRAAKMPSKPVDAEAWLQEVTSER